MIEFESDKYYLLKGEELQMLESMLYEMQTTLRQIVESKNSELPDKDDRGRETLIYHDLF
jgi:hypothetical protein